MFSWDWLVFNSYCRELKNSQNVLLHQPHHISRQSVFGLLKSAYCSPEFTIGFKTLPIGLLPSRTTTRNRTGFLPLLCRLQIQLSSVSNFSNMYLPEDGNNSSILDLWSAFAMNGTDVRTDNLPMMDFIAWPIGV